MVLRSRQTSSAPAPLQQKTNFSPFQFKKNTSKWAAIVLLSACMLLSDNFFLEPESPSSPRFRHLAEKEVAATPTTTSENGIDVVVVSGGVNCALGKTIDGLLENLIPTVRQIHIILPSQIVGVCQQMFDSKKDVVKCVDQDTVDPLTLRDVQNVLAEKGGEWATIGDRAGWYQQQLIKLFANQYLDLSDKFAIWDADLVLTKPFTLFDEEGKVTILTCGNGINIYDIPTKALLSYTIPRKDTVTHFLGIESNRLAELFDAVCEEPDDATSCATEMLHKIPAKLPAGDYGRHKAEDLAFSEYTLYHAFMMKNYEDSITLRSDLQQKRLQKTLVTDETCDILDEDGETGMVVLENHRAGTPRTMDSAVPSQYQVPKANFMKYFLETAKRPECKNPKYFEEDSVTRWYCLDDIKPNDCTIYSFGIADKWDFDDFFHEYGCKVYSYDPSNGLDKHQRAKNHFFDSVAVGASDRDKNTDYQVKTLQTLMKENGDDFIDILRIDTEGAEWELLGSFIEDNLFDKVRYFSAEIHMWEELGYHEYFYHYLSGIPMKLLWQSRKSDPINKETREELSSGVARVYEVIWGH